MNPSQSCIKQYRVNLQHLAVMLMSQHLIIAYPECLQIPLGVLPMHVQQYVPSKEAPTEVVHSDGEVETIDDVQFHTSIIGWLLLVWEELNWYDQDRGTLYHLISRRNILTSCKKKHHMWGVHFFGSDRAHYYCSNEGVRHVFYCYEYCAFWCLDEGWLKTKILASSSVVNEHVDLTTDFKGTSEAKRTKRREGKEIKMAFIPMLVKFLV